MKNENIVTLIEGGKECARRATAVTGVDLNDGAYRSHFVGKNAQEEVSFDLSKEAVAQIVKATGKYLDDESIEVNTEMVFSALLQGGKFTGKFVTK